MSIMNPIYSFHKGQITPKKKCTRLFDFFCDFLNLYVTFRLFNDFLTFFLSDLPLALPFSILITKFFKTTSH